MKEKDICSDCNYDTDNKWCKTNHDKEIIMKKGACFDYSKKRKQ